MNDDDNMKLTALLFALPFSSATGTFSSAKGRNDEMTKLETIRAKLQARHAFTSRVDENHALRAEAEFGTGCNPATHKRSLAGNDCPYGCNHWLDWFDTCNIDDTDDGKCCDLPPQTINC